MAESEHQLGVAVMRNQPKMLVKVMPNTHVVHEGKSYYGAGYGVEKIGGKNVKVIEHGEDAGDEVVLDGPTAFGLALAGQVTIVRSA